MKVTQDANIAATYDDIYRVPGVSEPGLSLDPLRIHFGNNSGYQALNLAVLLGAKRILLTGYDMQCGKDGKKHWHGDHPVGFNNPSVGTLKTWCRNFETTLPDLKEAGVEVINCSRETALTCFPRQLLEETL